MRIVFISTMSGCSWGGSEELWFGAALSMSRKGHEVYVSVYKWPITPSQICALQASGCRMHYRLCKKSIRARLIEKITSRSNYSGSVATSIKWLKTISPDFVLISSGFPLEGIDWMLSCRKLGIRYASVVQAASEFWWPIDGVLKNLRDAYSGASRLFFVSGSNRNLLEMQCGMKLHNSTVVSNPFNVDVQESLAWPSHQGFLELACVGRIDPRTKGQDLLLGVVAMKKWRERSLNINFYGSGPCEESVRRIAKLMEIDNVTFHGHVSDIESVWRINHGLVLPSRIEGLPLAIVEAMLCGRLVITTDVAGNSDYITDGFNGFIAAAPTENLLDDAMERAWLRRSDWREIGDNSRKAVMKHVPVDPIGRFVDALTTSIDSDDVT